MRQGQFPERFNTGSLVAVLTLLAIPLLAQGPGHYEAPTDIGLWQVPVTAPQVARPHVPAGTVSVELLRYPLSGKARHMLQKALRSIETGDHPAAIQQLQETLTKYPSSAAYAQSLLGPEYLKTNQIPEAVDSLEQAVNLLPHDAINHTNLGLSLVSAGEFDRARKELHRALELDSRNSTASRLLAALSTTE
jgi:Flp pilus assembly protein TadD